MKRMAAFLLILVLAFVLSSGIAAEHDSREGWLPTEAPVGFIRADGMVLRDEAGIPFSLRAIRFGDLAETADPFVPLSGAQSDEAAYADMSAMGFNAVRLTLRPEYFREPANAQAAWAWLDQQAAWAGLYQVRLILTMTVDLAGEASAAFWQDRGRQEEVIALWAQIAQRYRDEPSVLAYDLLNEPCTFQDADFASLNGEAAYMQWVQYADELAGAIRAQDGNHLLIMQSLQTVYIGRNAVSVMIGNGQGNMMRIYDDNTAYTFDFLEGNSFSTQGMTMQTDAPLYHTYPGYKPYFWSLYYWADTSNQIVVRGADTQEWTLLEMEPYTVQNPDHAVGTIVLKGDRLGETGTAYFDNLTLIEYDERGDVVGEPYRMFFEGVVSTSFYWSEDESGYPSHLSDSGMDGSACMAISQTAAGSGLGVGSFPLTQGHTYRLSVWVKGEGLAEDARMLATIDLNTPTDGAPVWLDRDQVEQSLAPYIAFGENNQVPVVMNNLFAGLETFKNDVGGDRWLNDLTALCDQYTMGYCYHAYFCDWLSPWPDASAAERSMIPSAVREALCASNGQIIRGTEQTFDMVPLGVGVTIPAGWTCTQSGADGWWLFHSVWQNAELAFCVIDNAWEDECAYILSESEQGSAFFIGARETAFAGRNAVRYTDEAEQFCARVALEDGRVLYASYSDRGDNAELLEAVLTTLTLTDADGQRAAHARATEIAAFSGTTQALEMEAEYLDEIHGLNGGEFSGLTVCKRMVNETPLYEIFRDDVSRKPLIVFLHGGGEGGNKTEMMETACRYANDGFFALCIDAAAYGESALGPMDAMFGTAETVLQIDGLIEYYNTVPGADADRFCLYGHSMGGFIAFSYVAHGRYRPTAIACSCSTPNLVEMTDGPLYAATDYAIHIPTIHSREEIAEFAQSYSAVHWPERFLDVTVYACNGLDDDIVYPSGCQQLEAMLTELGGDRFTFLYMEGRGHGDQYALEDFQPRDTLCAAVMQAVQ